MKVFITSGGTSVPIDEVRSITNNSKGTYGASIAMEFSYRMTSDKDRLYFSFSKGSMHPAKLNCGVGRTTSGSFYTRMGARFNDYQYSTYDEYVEQNIILIKSIQPDIIISAAAVSDYNLAPIEGKMDSGDELVLTLKRTQKVLPLMRAAAPNALIVGFKLLVGPNFDEVDKAVRKVLNRGSDCVVYNDLRELRKGDGTRLIFTKNMSYRKAETSKELVDLIIQCYEQKQTTLGFDG